MFKMFFVDLTNISSEISLEYLYKDKEPSRLNILTVRIYHKLFIKRKT